MPWESIGLIAARGGPWGIVALAVISLIQGWLVPRRTHEDRVADLKATIAALEATVHERERQIGIMLERVKEPTL